MSTSDLWTGSTAAMAKLVAAAVVVAGLVPACGDGGSSGLLGGSGATGGTLGNGEPASLLGDGGTIVTTTDSGVDPGRALFDALAPSLTATCGGPCHVEGKGGAPAWLAPPDAYASAVVYPGIVAANPESSILLTKGRHEGPDLVDPLRTRVQQWLQAEAQFAKNQALPTTDPFAIKPGTNAIDISKAGTGMAGAKLTFQAQAAGSVLTLSNMQVLAPPAVGVHVVAPIFVVIPAHGAEEPDQSFSNEDETIAAGQSATLQPGMLILTDWAADATMRIEFTKLEAVAVSLPDAGSGPTGGGCKAVAAFTANAVPAIQQNGCLGCHAKGGSGNGALDLSALAASPPDDATACNQALTRANPQNPPQSDIVLAPTGGVANHPFKNASSTFATMMEAWIGAEK
jgi:hypothetical protein